MKRKMTLLLIAGLFLTGTASACEYKAGETKYLDYAHCLYGEDQVTVAELPENTSWDRCIYRTQAFMPAKLLAVTRDRDGIEEANINCRGCIGNPCYLMKSACDRALEAQLSGS
jgi:hypothetical protein